MKISNRMSQALTPLKIFVTRRKFLTGFTLGELTVVIALFSVLITVGVGIFLYNNRFYETQSGEIFSITATREASDRINEYARAAVAFEPSRIYDGRNYTTGTQVVILKLPALDAADQVISEKFDYAIIGSNPSNAKRLELILDPDAVSSRGARLLLLSERLTSINFTYDDPNLALARKLSYEIVVTDIGRSPGSEQIFGSATLRNK